MRDLIYHPLTDFYTYAPTGETFPASELDAFANKKLYAALLRLEAVCGIQTDGSSPKVFISDRIGGPKK